MGELLVELIPSMLGLITTPAAIVGGILLLGTPRPFADALSFMAAFLLVHTIIAVVVVGVAATRTEPLLSARAKSGIELGVGVLMLALAVVMIARRPGRRQARAA